MRIMVLEKEIEQLNLENAREKLGKEETITQLIMEKTTLEGKLSSSHKTISELTKCKEESTKIRKAKKKPNQTQQELHELKRLKTQYEALYIKANDTSRFFQWVTYILVILN